MLISSRQTGAISELLVAYRFLEAGRIPSWPLVPCSYDLVVDGGNARYRVQVKHARVREEATGLLRYDLLTTKRRATGDRPIHTADLDYLCVVCTAAKIFVIPTAACTSPTDPCYLTRRISLGSKGRFAPFLNRFTLGDGWSTEVTTHADLAKLRVGTAIPATSPWKKANPFTQRKAHVRLSTADAQAIRAMTIGTGPGQITLEAVAQQFHISLVTLRNLLLGKRKDL